MLIHLEKLGKSFGEKVVLHDVSASVEKEDRIGIVGPNYQKLNDVMQQLAHKYQVTKPAIAIAWLLRHPAHMQPIVGTTSSQHLKETIKACDFTLTRQEWYDLYLASEKPLP